MEVQKDPRNWSNRGKVIGGAAGVAALAAAGTLLAVNTGDEGSSSKGLANVSTVCATATSPARTVTGPSHIVSIDGQQVHVTQPDVLTVPEATAQQCATYSVETQTVTVTTGAGTTTTLPTTTAPTTTAPVTTTTPSTTTTPAGFNPGPKAPYPTTPGCTNVAGTTGVVSCYNATWTWDKPVNLSLVQIKIDETAPTNVLKGILLRQGSGTVDWIRINTSRCDGMIGSLSGATINHERIKLTDTSGLVCHNDGNQINQASNVAIHDAIVMGTGHSGLFISNGSGGVASQKVVMDTACIGPLPDGRNFDVDVAIATSSDSGIKDSKLGPVKQSRVYIPNMPHGDPTAIRPVNTGNTDVNTCPDPVPSGY